MTRSTKVAVGLVGVVMVFAGLARVCEASEVFGRLLTSQDPWIIEAADGALYRAEWYGGTTLFWDGDRVLLTERWGFAYLVGLSGLSKGKKARVWVDEIGW